jgi:2-polyprenyl-3-methyl-5-hydroxy-6-metoxy-1,4-benzoquinol methylase
MVRELRLSPILDVGAAQGMLGDLIQGSGLTIDGVEANPEWAQLAGPFYRNVFASTVENAPLRDGEYRLVVCGDVLEHTADPVAVLRRLRQAATPDATFIISVPNIAHLAVRMMLLFGRFPKMDRGPLDRTHLHFFTKDTARQMIESAGLRVQRTTCTGVPLDEIWKKGVRHLFYRTAMKMQHGALAVAPRLFGFQWIMVARA